jgi:lipid-binding SYLF domain-containing protein
VNNGSSLSRGGTSHGSSRCSDDYHGGALRLPSQNRQERQMNLPSLRAAISGLVAFAFVAVLSACSTTPAQQSALDDNARTALNSLYATVPAAQGVAEKSKAVLVFPSVTKAGLGIGGQFGNGVLFENGQPTGYYNISGGSFGLQAGAQTFSQAYFFTNQQALDNFRRLRGVEVGAGLNVAVANMGASGEISSSTLQQPVVVFVWGQQGLMAGATINGQKITRINSPNENNANQG